MIYRHLEESGGHESKPNKRGDGYERDEGEGEGEGESESESESESDGNNTKRRKLTGYADSIFHDEQSGTLFASMKYVGYDYAGDMERMRENPKVREWWSMTDGWQESLVPGATNSAAEPDQPSWWKPVPEVFYLP